MSDSVRLSCGTVQNMTGAAGLLATGAGPWVYKNSPDSTVQVILTGTGAITATVVVEVSNGGGFQGTMTPPATVTDTPIPIATLDKSFTLSGTTSVSDGYASQNASWKWIRINVTALTGTGAKVIGLLGT